MSTLARERRATLVAILGGGFGGLNAAKRLAGAKSVQVVLIDRRNHHLFQPLLYQVATAALNPADIAVPIRAQFRGTPNVDVQLRRVRSVDLDARLLCGDGFEQPYDYLIVACGAQHSYFGHPEWEPDAPGLKTLEQATEIRRRILTAFERAENETDPEERTALLTFVIVGGGPTGVELAGAIADISRAVLRGDFRRIDPARARVILVEAGPHVLGSFTGALSERARRDLTELGVEVRTGERAEDISADGVRLDGTHVRARSVFWAAGVRASALDVHPVVEMDRAGRIVVTDDLSVPGYRTVFVVGDKAAFPQTAGQSVPGMAPAAIQSGRYAAETILRDLHGRPRVGFVYRDKGQMATIGKNRAIAETPHFRLTGRIAWLGWLVLHLFYLVGFRNRVAVLLQWAWSYLFSRRGARLITEREWRLE